MKHSNQEFIKLAVIITFHSSLNNSSDMSGFIRSGKSGKKVPFTQGVVESQGKSGNLKIFA